MIEKEYTILSPNGMHARPATALIKLAKQFKSAISMKKGEKQARLNSILNILSMTPQSGDLITITIDGADEQEAAAAMDRFFTEQLKDL